MRLYIVRHAWAGQAPDPNYPNDELRPLTPEGRKRFAKLVKLLAKRDVGVNLIGTSPLVRTWQTAELLSRYLPGKPAFEERPELAPGGPLSAIIAWAGRLELESLAWVGHAPDVGDWAAALIGDAKAALRFAKGSIAAIDFPGPPARGAGELQWLASAKLLGC